jgi:predicted MFS family arabinose efflux permease
MLNAGSYLVVVAVLCSLPRTELRQVTRSPRGEGGIRAAFQYVMKTPAITAAASVAFMVAAFGRNFQLTMAAMSNSVFGAGSHGYGELSVVFAIGALCGGLVAARVRHHSLRVVVLVAVAASSLQIASAFTPSFPAFAAAMFPVAIAAVVFDTAALATVQLAAGDAQRGRVIALFTTMAMLGATAGAPTLGWLADHYGARASLAAGGLVVLLGCATQRRRMTALA